MKSQGYEFDKQNLKSYLERGIKYSLENFFCFWVIAIGLILIVRHSTKKSVHGCRKESTDF